jgi:predicted dehydrogenase
VKVAVIGCGVISRAYVENAPAFESYELVACADLDCRQAEALGKASGLSVVSVDEAIDDPAIDVILNLTPPLAHASITARALAAGKHVYTEKPTPRAAACASAARPTSSSARPTRPGAPRSTRVRSESPSP